MKVFCEEVNIQHKKMALNLVYRKDSTEDPEQNPITYDPGSQRIQDPRLVEFSSILFDAFSLFCDHFLLIKGRVVNFNLTESNDLSNI